MGRSSRGLTAMAFLPFDPTNAFAASIVSALSCAIFIITELAALVLDIMSTPGEILVGLGEAQPSNTARIETAKVPLCDRYILNVPEWLWMSQLW